MKRSRRVLLSTSQAMQTGREYRHPDQKPPATKILIGTATLGLVTIQWHNGVRGMVVPPNWAATTVTPQNYHVWDAQNILVAVLLRDGMEWLFLLEDDNVPFADCLLKADGWMLRSHPRKGKTPEAGYPIISGLYYIKQSFVPDLGPEPLIYRGGGTRAFWDWTPGEVVRCDGVPTGCLLIHREILRAYVDEPDMVWYNLAGVPHPIPQVFHAPARVVYNEDQQATATITGTSDLHFCAEVKRRRLLEKAGWPKLQQSPYPFAVDTSWKTWHQDRRTGVMYPEIWPTKRPTRRRVA